MQIFIDNKPAAIKQGTSFDFVSENPLFTGAENYTLSITLPLRGCPQNIAIFGHINREDVVAGRVLFDGSIVDRNLTRHGTFAITEISEVEVKVQFLEGRSEQNYDDTFDKIYINELSLGEGSVIDKSKRLPSVVWNPSAFVDDDGGPRNVCLPWIRIQGSTVDRGQGNMAWWTQYQTFSGGTSYRWEWAEQVKHLTWQPYLLFITKQICRALGYSFDFSQWEKYDSLKYLLVCNTLPASYGLNDFARALPHWSVDEFFSQLELLLGGDFAIDHKERKISFNYWRDIMLQAGVIKIDNILAEHTVSVAIDDADCEYLGAKGIRYANNGASNWDSLCCPDFVNIFKKYFKNSEAAGENIGDRVPLITYPRISSMLSDVKSFYRFQNGYALGLPSHEQRRTPAYDAILYCEDVDQYFILNEYYRAPSASAKDSFTVYCDLVPLNIFGDRVMDPANAKDTEELQIVPARVGRDWATSTFQTRQRNILWLEPKSFDEDTEKQILGYKLSDLDTYRGKPYAQQALAKQADKVDLPEYYDKIFIGWYKGWQHDTRMDKVDGNMDVEDWPSEYLPFPEISEYYFLENLSSWGHHDFSLRLNSDAYLERTGLRKIDPRTKSTFKFLADTIPSPRAIFNICGKRYLCEKITATFTENGMSQLLSGDFYPLLDNL